MKLIRSFIQHRNLITKSTINPKSINLSIPENVNSLILLTTPKQLNPLLKYLSQNNETFLNSSKLENLIVASTDTICHSRNAISELWIENNEIINIKNIEKTKKIENKSKLHRQLEPLSVDPIRMSKNWKDIKYDGNININFINLNKNIKANLACTLFENNNYNTCFIIKKSLDNEINGQNLSNIEIEINSNNQISNINYSNKLIEIPLVEDEDLRDEEYQITSFESNMIKSINDQSASGYLIDNSIVTSSKKELFFKLYNKDKEIEKFNEEFYSLVAGGLGWGEKQAFLVVDPIVGNVGNRFVKLYYNKIELKMPKIESKDKTTIQLEVSELEQEFNEVEGKVENEDTIIINNVFSIGSENGIILNGVNHRAHGENIEIEI